MRSGAGFSHFSDTVEEELDEGVEEEAGQQAQVVQGLPMDVGAQEEGGGNDGHKGHLQSHTTDISNTTAQLAAVQNPPAYQC